MLAKINTTTSGLSGSPGGTPNSSRFGYRNSYFENAADTDSSINEDDPTEDDEESQQWGLAKGMDLFEVSAKDDMGTVIVPFPTLPDTEFAFVSQVSPSCSILL
jgi:hypothetical protein